MAKISSVTFVGASGKQYNFNVYPITEECPNESGIYIFSKRVQVNNTFTHTPIYIGKAQSFQNRFYNHHKDDCIDRNGANCICLMQVAIEKERDAAEKDLLANYNTKCNVANNTTPKAA